MKSQPRLRLRALCAIAMLSTTPLLLAAGNTGYYRWIDDQGAPQFTQKPPLDRPSEFIRTATGAATAVAGGGQDGAAPAKETEQPASTANGGLEAVPQQDAAKCQQTRETLGVLNSSARIREKGADGENRYLTPAEIGEQKRLAEEAIKIYCE
jgi:hypothetical protein